MKKLALFVTAAAMCACGGRKGFTVTGTLPEQAGAELALVTSSGDTLAVASADEAGLFTMKGNFEQPEQAVLVTDGDRVASLVVEPGTITLSAGEQRVNVTGTPANDAAMAFNESMAALMAESKALGEEATEEQRDAIYERYQTLQEEAVAANRDNLFGVQMFASVSGQSEKTARELLEEIALFSPEMQQTGLMERTRIRLEAKLNTEIGKPYIDVALPDVDGNVVALSSLVGEGKWVLIDFWATWCGPCCHEIPFLREAYAKYHAKGFEIYGVSLDNDRAKWVAFLPENGMTWVNVLGVDENRKSSASDSYAVQFIPTNYLISPEGKIVATGLRGEGIESTLAEYIK